MSEDWKPGDLAVCVNADKFHPRNHAPRHLREGGLYRVVGVTRPRFWLGGHRCAGVLLSEVCNSANPDGSFCAVRFRRVRPDTHEPCEEGFITLLTRTKRKVDA